MTIPSVTLSPTEMGNWLRYALDDASGCHFRQAATKAWSSENSEVISLPAFDFTQLFAGRPNQNIACSLVSISGHSSEPLHFHTSNVVGIMTKGSGTLKHKAANSAKEVHTEVSLGDVMFIPVRILHSFETPIGGLLEYIAFEISEAPIDYQKHLPENELLSAK